MTCREIHMIDCRFLTWSATLAAFWLSAMGSSPVRADSAEPVRAPNGMVVSENLAASKAGADVLAARGNAVDAAIATGLALAVTHPAAGNVALKPP